MSAERYDFRKPAPLPAALRNPLVDWLPRACQAACRQLAASLPFAVEMEPAGVEVVAAGQVLDSVAETAVRVRANLRGTADGSLLLLPRPVVLGLYSGLMGEPASDDRELTPVEEEVSDFLAGQFFLDPLQQSWPLNPKLILDAPTRLASRGSPYAPETLIVVLRFVIKGPFGQHTWLWTLPRSGWLDTVAGGQASAPTVSREERETLVRGLPVQLTVRLGATRLSLLQVAGLQIGDVLLLEQPVAEPLSASLGGQVKFLVWPGAVGTRQAVAIQSPVESNA